VNQKEIISVVATIDIENYILHQFQLKTSIIFFFNLSNLLFSQPITNILEYQVTRYLILELYLYYINYPNHQYY